MDDVDSELDPSIQISRREFRVLFMEASETSIGASNNYLVGSG
jgi:hypothetical protein